ncbi:MAG TPA: pyrroloquinoline quinone biosynthesis peptide chaperone PqqD [Candidatus Saccharimonadales bacterium]|nr:pyrroloquinoline quinone biosynthesis peptide chaperone PqqD [Candidatus Baltobacteraceae bacterium]HUA66941.1 pyrroloquinoline quinone biosynthesis peptide chaperone PqqD [Candidatus Saccharimonadales bacterium]
MNAILDISKPRLAGKARLKWDAVREKHLLLFPEGLLVLNKTAHDVLALCDGQRTVGEIVKILGAQYANGAIDGDVKEILQKLADKSFVALNE